MEAELNRRGENPIVRARNRERPGVLREVVTAQVWQRPTCRLRGKDHCRVVEVAREAVILNSFVGR
eukprot:15450607-Alexandrium_andersonii.AAC.1